MDWSHPPEWFGYWALATVSIGMTVQVVYFIKAVIWVGAALWEAAKKETTHDPR